jgi:hypothetical protein
MTVDQALSLAMKWAKLIGVIALLGFILLTLAKLFGFSFYPVATIDWQAFGIFVAGTTYALKHL